MSKMRKVKIGTLLVAVAIGLGFARKKFKK